jgi:hypothetical protein
MRYVEVVIDNTVIHEFEDTKGVIRLHKSKDRQHKWPKEKGEITIYKTYI